MQSINLFISSVYHPTDKKLQTEFNDYLSSIYSTIPSNYVFISGQDLNASIGIKSSIEICKNMCCFGLNNRNEKGLEVLNDVFQV